MFGGFLKLQKNKKKIANLLTYGGISSTPSWTFTLNKCAEKISVPFGSFPQLSNSTMSETLIICELHKNFFYSTILHITEITALCKFSRKPITKMQSLHTKVIESVVFFFFILTKLFLPGSQLDRVPRCH